MLVVVAVLVLLPKIVYVIASAVTIARTAATKLSSTDNVISGESMLEKPLLSDQSVSSRARAKSNVQEGGVFIESDGHLL